MPRPSLKDERKEQILDAYEVCVARHGVEGATLERVAEEAGLARALIRHNVGNRDDLLAAFLERFFDRENREAQEMFDMLPARKRLETLVEWLFDPAYADTHSVRVSEALIAASADDPKLAARMRAWTAGFVADIETVIAEAAPQVDEQRRTAIAAGITGIYFNVESLWQLGDMPEFLDASKRAALLLLEGLE